MSSDNEEGRDGSHSPLDSEQQRFTDVFASEVTSAPSASSPSAAPRAPAPETRIVPWPQRNSRDLTEGEQYYAWSALKYTQEELDQLNRSWRMLDSLGKPPSVTNFPQWFDQLVDFGKEIHKHPNVFGKERKYKGADDEKNWFLGFFRNRQNVGRCWITG